MRLDEYVRYDATGLASLVKAAVITPLELTRLARDAHVEINPRINAVIEFYEDAETVVGSNEGIFAAVPFLRKDTGASEAGRLQENASRLFKGYRPNTESHFFRRAREAGLRTLGRTTMPEFGTSGMSQSILNGITGNPWDLNRSAGGSSSGSAAAVAAGITPIAHGNDGGGSIRVPAAWCGLIGLNPSRGRVSGGPNNQDALLGRAREFVICRTVRDMAAALDVFSGSHPGDPFIVVQPKRSYQEELSQPTGALKVGVAMTKWGAVDVEPEVLEAVDSTATLLEELGHRVAEIEPPYESAEYFRILLANSARSAHLLDEAAQAMGRTINADTLEPANLKLYEYGRRASPFHAGDIHELMRRLRVRVGEAIEPYDILLTPTMPFVALTHGSIYCTTNPTLSAEEFKEADAALFQYLGVFNATGQPAVSLPLAQSSSGMPIGLQIVGRFGDEATLVRVARDLEEARPWRGRHPKIWAGANSLRFANPL
ncbi:amidase [Mesorhizobium loti]|uniref:Indoleacetamide hydrolase n=1 Tax=Mesorhizobium erdmanii TaxID=1777866 RepID=A0A6M7UPN7_9HYPH|nr:MULTISPECIES: amidase [Mesorhizobium]OBP77752.1 amidase [Mesorhizobium loti]OBQ63775.1 amidase [Mesorhizobium loti]QKC79211.1 amidase [Mesorhizobium erdmanii]